jgi:hypothetical protein
LLIYDINDLASIPQTFCPIDYTVKEIVETGVAIADVPISSPYILVRAGDGILYSRNTAGTVWKAVTIAA